MSREVRESKNPGRGLWGHHMNTEEDLGGTKAKVNSHQMPREEQKGSEKQHPHW